MAGSPTGWHVARPTDHPARRLIVPEHPAEHRLGGSVGKFGAPAPSLRQGQLGLCCGHDR